MSTTIYVGNIQSIKDEQLQEYFERFGKIEAFFHNCRRAADEWLIDYRFIRFSNDTDMSKILTNKIDHTICRIRLDVHPYDVAFRDDTRLTSDRKICITHTNPRLDRNVVKKAFTKYGRILNCTCVSSGNGVEHVYIEFDMINSIQSVFANKKQQHFAGQTSLAVKKPLRPAEVGVKEETISINKRELIESPLDSFRQRLNSNVDTAQYSSVLVNQSNSNLRSLTPIQNQYDSTQICSQERLKELEQEYDMIICQDFDEITDQINRFIQNQKQSYCKVREYIFPELHSHSSSSSSSSENEDGEINSSSDSESSKSRSNKRLKTRH